MPRHRESLLEFAANPRTQPQFLRFANAITNDVNFHMEDALKALSGIREIEKEQDDAAVWSGLSNDTRSEKESLLRSTYNQGRGALHRVMEQICLMALVTEQTAQVWLCKDLRNRLAAALGYFLDQLVGPSRSKLRVKDMERLEFKPLEVLLPMVTVYGNLADGGSVAGADANERQVRCLLFVMISCLMSLTVASHVIKKLDQFKPRCEGLFC